MMRYRFLSPILLSAVAFAATGCRGDDTGLPGESVSTVKGPEISAATEKLPLTSAVNVDADTEDQSILSDRLDNGWENWSWAKTKAKAGTLHVQIRKAWEGVFFEHIPQASSRFSELDFTIENGPQDLAVFQLRARVNDRPLAAFMLSEVKANETKKYRVTLAQAGLSDENFDGFMIQTADTGTFVVKDVLLKGHKPARS